MVSRCVTTIMITPPFAGVHVTRIRSDGLSTIHKHCTAGLSGGTDRRSTSRGCALELGVQSSRRLNLLCGAGNDRSAPADLRALVHDRLSQGRRRYAVVSKHAPR